MVLAGNKAKRFSLVNHTTKTIHHHQPQTSCRYFTLILNQEMFIDIEASLHSRLPMRHWENTDAQLP